MQHEEKQTSNQAPLSDIAGEEKEKEKSNGHDVHVESEDQLEIGENIRSPVSACSVTDPETPRPDPYGRSPIHYSSRLVSIDYNAD